MRAFILTLGTRGDFELFLTLGAALHRRGHHVTIGTSAFYLDRVREAGLDGIEIGGGSRDALRGLLRSLRTVRDRKRRTYEFYLRWIRPQLSAGMARITATAETADYFVSNLKLTMARGEDVMAGATVTYDPPTALEDLPRYGGATRGGRVIDLVAMPKELVDPAGRWGAHYLFTGFWQSPPGGISAPGPALAAFVEAEAPPIVLAMGSMATFDAARLLTDVVAALRLTGQRAVVVGGWSEAPPIGAPPALVHWVAEAPYGWLFPRAACVIHHGGTGTLAAVLGTARPSILFPQILTQEVYARLLDEAGLVAGVFDTDALAPEALAAAITRAVTDGALADRCRRWQAIAAGARGVEAAVDHIEAHQARIGTLRAETSP